MRPKLIGCHDRRLFTLLVTGWRIFAPAVVATVAMIASLIFRWMHSIRCSVVAVFLLSVTNSIEFIAIIFVGGFSVIVSSVLITSAKICQSIWLICDWIAERIHPIRLTYHFWHGPRDDLSSRTCPYFCVSPCDGDHRVLSNGFYFCDPAIHVDLVSSRCDRPFGAAKSTINQNIRFRFAWNCLLRLRGAFTFPSALPISRSEFELAADLSLPFSWPFFLFFADDRFGDWFDSCWQHNDFLFFGIQYATFDLKIVELEENAHKHIVGRGFSLIFEFWSFGKIEGNVILNWIAKMGACVCCYINYSWRTNLKLNQFSDSDCFCVCKRQISFSLFVLVLGFHIVCTSGYHLEMSVILELYQRSYD